MAKREKCPNCGNTKDLQDNGLKPTAYGYTLLCVAKVKPADWAFDHVKPEPDQIDENGMVECGMQWSPNEG